MSDVPYTAQILALLKQALIGDGIPGVVWYAKGGGLRRSGPYATPKKAAEMFRLRDTGMPPDDFSYWPEPASNEMPANAPKPPPKQKKLDPSLAAALESTFSVPVPSSRPTQDFYKLPMGVPVDEHGFTLVTGVSQTFEHYARAGGSRTICGHAFTSKVKPTKQPVVGDDKKLCGRCAKIRRGLITRAEREAAFMEEDKKLFVIFDEQFDEYLAWVSEDGCWLKVSETLAGAARYKTCTEAEAVIDRLIRVAREKGAEHDAQRLAEKVIETVADAMHKNRRPKNHPSTSHQPTPPTPPTPENT